MKIVQRKVAQLRVAIRLMVFPYIRPHASVRRRHVCVSGFFSGHQNFPGIFFLICDPDPPVAVVVL